MSRIIARVVGAPRVLEFTAGGAPLTQWSLAVAGEREHATSPATRASRAKADSWSSRPKASVRATVPMR